MSEFRTRLEILYGEEKKSKIEEAMDKEGYQELIDYFREETSYQPGSHHVVRHETEDDERYIVSFNMMTENDDFTGITVCLRGEESELEDRIYASINHYDENGDKEGAEALDYKDGEIKRETLDMV